MLSHLHSDHVGGLGHVTGAAWLISARDAGGHGGALTCRMPEHADTVLVRPGDDPFGAFARSMRVTADGDVRVVPTPGHSSGHQSLLIRDGVRWVLLTGDVVFDRGRLEDGRAMAGIVEDPAAARRSIDVVTRQLAEFDTLLAAAHDEKAGSAVTERPR